MSAPKQLCYPQELIDWFVDILAEDDDKEALEACTLVHPRWLHRSLHYLRVVTRIARKDYAKKLFVFGGEGNRNTVHVKVLTIEGAKLKDEDFLGEIQPITTRMVNITTLTICGISVDDLSPLISIITALHNLNHLTMDHLVWTRDDEAGASPKALATPGSDLHSLKHLEIGYGSRTTMEHIVTLLRNAGASPNILEFKPILTFCNVTQGLLRCFSSLRQIKIHIPRLQTAGHAYLEILANTLESHQMSFTNLTTTIITRERNPDVVTEQMAQIHKMLSGVLDWVEVEVVAPEARENTAPHAEGGTGTGADAANAAANNYSPPPLYDFLNLLPPPYVRQPQFHFDLFQPQPGAASGMFELQYGFDQMPLQDEDDAFDPLLPQPDAAYNIFGLPNDFGHMHPPLAHELNTAVNTGPAVTVAKQIVQEWEVATRGV